MAFMALTMNVLVAQEQSSALIRTIKSGEGHIGAVTSVAYSPDCKILASGSWDTTLKLWVTSLISLPATLAFADTKVGETAVKDLIIKNTGNLPLKIAKITWSAGFTGDWSEGTIAAKGEKVVKVTFKPAEARDYSGTVTVVSDARSGKNTLSISGKRILVTGIEPGQALPGFKVFPNSAGDVLHVKLPNQSPVNLQLTDVNGQVVYEQEAITSDKLSIDVSGYKSGVYVLVLESGGKVEKRKVVIK